MINTFNETSLHKELKKRYAGEYGGLCEQYTGKYICDLVTDDGQIIEIQTARLGALKQKLTDLLESRKVRVVFPLAENTVIEMYNSEGVLLHRRKSPKKNTVFSVYKELTSLTELLLHGNFTLEVLFIDIIDRRLRTETPVQLKNKSRRWKRNWYKSDKILVSLNHRIFFSRPEDYAQPLLTCIPAKESVFTVPILEKSPAGTYARVFVWILKKLSLLEELEKTGRTKQYKLKDTCF